MFPCSLPSDMKQNKLEKKTKKTKNLVTLPQPAGFLSSYLKLLERPQTQ